jgi:hypothetical protein
MSDMRDKVRLLGDPAYHPPITSAKTARRQIPHAHRVLDVLQDAFPGITWARFGQGFAFTKNRVAL